MLGFFGFGTKSAKLLFLGLDNAGKTTLLHMLKDDKVAQHRPTLHAGMMILFCAVRHLINCIGKEELIIGNVRNLMRLRQLHSQSCRFNSLLLILADMNQVVKFELCEESWLTGLLAARKLWSDYFPTVDGIVYIIDSSDRERFPESKKELDVRIH